MLTKWSEAQTGPGHRYVMCSGGGPGIMEAANREVASDAGGKTIGLNIGLPFEQQPNGYITDKLSFQFHYFFMRKFWFAYLAKALVVFPGGFGTMDELFEILTLVQTGKLKKKMQILLYGTEFWKEVVNFDALVRYGTIAAKDLELFKFADDTGTAFQILKDFLSTYDCAWPGRRAAGYATAISGDCEAEIVFHPCIGPFFMKGRSPGRGLPSRCWRSCGLY